jgi:hypothetical protein
MPTITQQIIGQKQAGLKKALNYWKVNLFVDFDDCD